MKSDTLFIFLFLVTWNELVALPMRGVCKLSDIPYQRMFTTEKEALDFIKLNKSRTKYGFKMYELKEKGDDLQ